eukprot:10228-Heterococcus_DN1.PRE.4
MLSKPAECVKVAPICSPVACISVPVTAGTAQVLTHSDVTSACSTYQRPGVNDYALLLLQPLHYFYAATACSVGSYLLVVPLTALAAKML